MKPVESGQFDLHLMSIGRLNGGSEIWQPSVEKLQTTPTVSWNFAALTEHTEALQLIDLWPEKAWNWAKLTEQAFLGHGDEFEDYTAAISIQQVLSTPHLPWALDDLKKSSLNFFSAMSAFYGSDEHEHL